MTGSLTEAARLPQADRDQAVLTGDAEGQAAIALLGQLSGSDWQRPTDCPEWDVRALVSHLVGQCEDALRLRTSLRRELACRRRYPGRPVIDAHMAVQVSDHRAESGPEPWLRWGCWNEPGLGLVGEMAVGPDGLARCLPREACASQPKIRMKGLAPRKQAGAGGHLSAALPLFEHWVP